MAQDFVLIVGAGPTGMLLAIWLKAMAPDLPFQIIDRASGPGTASRAMVVHARTIELYRQLGLADDLLEQGQILNSTSIVTAGVIRGRASFAGLNTGITKYPLVLAYPQDRHERLLLARLDALGVKVQWNTALESLEPHDDRVQASFGGQTRSFNYVAGCDGAHSPVRHALSIPMDGATYPHLFYVADVHTSTASDPSQMRICPGSKDFAVCIPLKEEGNFRVFHTVPDSTGQETTFHDLQSSIETMTCLKIEDVIWSSVYRVHHRKATSFQQGRVFLLGDAAHLHSPVGGQGMNTGLGDATNLGWKLANVFQGKASAQILDTYTLEREPFAKTLVATTDRAFQFVTQQSFFGYVIRRWYMAIILPLLWHFSAFRQFFFLTVSQLRIAYTESPLSEGQAGTVKAGMRLPWIDLGMKGNDNFEMLIPPHWQIHVYGMDELLEAQWNGFSVYQFEFTSAAKNAGIVRDTWYLVRPDGHVAMICKRQDVHVLKAYVEKWELLA